MAKKNLKGKFITFEGSEGSGKSTQTKLLSDYLRSKGFSVVHVREPGSTIISEKIRRILLEPKNKKISYLSEMLLYMAARAQLVEDVIKPALKKGKIIICDRFLDATLAYQGYGGGININFIKTIGRQVTRGIKPDITFFLDLDVKEGLRRIGKTKDRIERRSVAYHKRVKKGHLILAKKEPKRIKIIPVKKNKAETQHIIRKFVDRLI